MIEVSFDELLDRVCGCLGPKPGETECPCESRLRKKIEAVAAAAGISERQARLAIEVHERNLRIEFGDVRCLIGSRRKRDAPPGTDPAR
jgi:hypothetical protein